MPRKLFRLTALSTLLFAILIASQPRAGAQNFASASAHPVVDRNDGLSAFATFSQVNTDYGRTDSGATFGVDFTRNYDFLHFVVPSIEARYVTSSGSNITQDSFLGGIKAERPIGRFHPYANLELGYGVIHFNPALPGGYNRDNSVVYDIGAGLDYRVNRMFLVKLDAQQQYWSLGNANSELEPYNLSAGVVYRIPFGWGRTH